MEVDHDGLQSIESRFSFSFNKSELPEEENKKPPSRPPFPNGGNEMETERSEIHRHGSENRISQ